MDLPTQFTKPNLINLDQKDTIPSNIDPSTISHIGRFSMTLLAFFISNQRTAASAQDNGQGVTLYSVTTNDPKSEYQSWWAVDTVLIRFDTGVLPSGRFPAHLGRLNPYGVGATIGYDAAVCVQKYEPWIVETYNTSIVSPSTLQVIGKADGGTPLPPSGRIQGAPIANTRYINTTGKNQTFVAAHDDNVDQMWKVNVLGTSLGYHTPSATVGPAMPPVFGVSSNPDPLRRPFLSPTARDGGDTLNSHQSDSAISSRGSVRLTLPHTLRGPHPSSRNRMRMRRYHMLLTSRGN